LRSCRWVTFAAAFVAGCAAPDADPGYAGRESCAECHPRETELWAGSDHDRAMERATPETVLGDFGRATAEHFAESAVFLWHEGRPAVRTRSADGTSSEQDIAYTFGVDPLQQYLVERPGGRLQVLPWCWDSRAAAAGGQRWFHIYPGEAVPEGDPLHWAGPNQNWNHMCAECHSTNLVKGYREKDDRFETTWSEIDVSCEACHGPAAAHVTWARAAAGEDPLAARPIAEREVDTCARCHSRRSTISEEPAGGPLLDTHRPALLDEGLYHADGQMLDEVYEWGSFLQSEMFLQDVKCSDCHDPHSARLRVPGNALCGQCHSMADYDSPVHHFHEQGSEGAQCVSCHMPATTYMVVDPRRDHSLRIPRPDVSAKLGTPDACTACHADRTAAWAAEAVAGWYGTSRRKEPHWGEAIHAGRTAAAGADEALLGVVADRAVPPIARATAVSLLPRYAPPELAPALGAAAADDDPLVRFAAARAASSVEPGARADLLLRLLADSVRAVRLEAGRSLAAVPAESFAAADRARLDTVLQEWRAAERRDADRAESHLNLASLAADLGALDEAERELEKAIRLDPAFAPARVNLADLWRARGREDEAERVLREAVLAVPQDAAVRYALALLLVRTGRVEEAVTEARNAADRAPDVPRYRVVLVLALERAGEAVPAGEALREAAARFPGDPEIRALAERP
jgi:predicted CXXCH cytochrome family protein